MDVSSTTIAADLRAFNDAVTEQVNASREFLAASQTFDFSRAEDCRLRATAHLEAACDAYTRACRRMKASVSTETYAEVVAAAVADLTEHGYDSEQRVAYWSEQLRLAAERSLKTPEELERMVREAMAAVYRRQVDEGAVLRRHAGVSRFTLERLRPALHADLSRRVAANADLIKLNRRQAIDKTLHRFRGWATSVPAGGSETIDRRETKTELRKALAQLPFEDRRVVIDQTAKLNASISATVALGGGAIGASWHSHKYQAGYDGRPAHNARDGHFFLVRDSWAHEKGYVKPGPDGYMDGVEQPAQLPFCRCFWAFSYSLRSVPDQCMTEKGREALRQARAAIHG